MNCIFCDRELGGHPRDGYHHLLPRQFIKILSLKNEDWKKHEIYKVPICYFCHLILTELLKPVVFVSKFFRGDHSLQLDITLPTIMSRLEGIKREASE